ncbi:unnamed protein product, partial [Polarella glacialis]
ATAFSPNGKLLACAGENSVVSILLVDRDFELVADLPCPAGVRCIGWSPDGRCLASGGEDRQVTVWDVLKKRIAFQLPRSQDWLCSLAFSSDSRYLATCCFGGAGVCLHSLDSKKDGAKAPELKECKSESQSSLPNLAPRTSSSGMHPPLRPRLKSAGTVKDMSESSDLDLLLDCPVSETVIPAVSIMMIVPRSVSSTSLTVPTVAALADDDEVVPSIAPVADVDQVAECRV